MSEVIVSVRLKDLQEIYENLKYVQEKNLKGVKFNYVIARIIVELQKQKESLEKSIEPSKEFQQLEQERAQLIMKYCEKDEDGNPIFTDEKKTQVKINEEFQKELQEEMNELIEKYDDVLKEREQQVKEFEKLIKEESVELKVPKLSIDELPEDIDGKTMEALVKLNLIAE